MNSFDRLQEVADLEDDLASLVRIVEQWSGLAVLAKEGGEVLVASTTWLHIDISPEELRMHGWKEFVFKEDLAATEHTAEMYSGPDGRSVTKFRNRYISRSGILTQLEWMATPFSQWNGLTLALARVIRSAHVSKWDDDYGDAEKKRDADLRDMIFIRAAEKWRSRFRQVECVYRWVADLEGHVLFSEGAGLPVGHFVGTKMGRDYGLNPEFFAAVETLLSDGAPESIVQHARMNPDNHKYPGVRFLHVYSLLRTAGGTPFAIAITSVDTTAGIMDLDCPETHAGEE